MKFLPLLCLWLLTIATTISNPAAVAAATAPWEIEALPSTKAPAFSLPDLSGKTITSATFQGKVLLINFWATWCAPCREEMPALDRLQKQFSDKGLAVLGISIDNEPGLIKDFLKGSKTEFTVLHDSGLKSHDAYKVFAYPTTFLVDSKGIIQKYWIGPQEWEGEAFKKILQGYLP